MHSPIHPTSVWKLLLVAALVAGTSIGVAAQTLLANIPVGAYPTAVAVNPTADKIYVANRDSNNVTVINGVTNGTTTVRTGTGPDALAVNTITSKVYVANSGGTVTVIDGGTNQTSTVNAGQYPFAIAVNATTNKIYVANHDSNTVTVVNGSNNSTSTVNVGRAPSAIAVNSASNKIYVANYGSNDVAIIDGATNSLTSVAVGTSPRAIAVNPVTNRIYVANYRANSVSVIDGISGSVMNVSVGASPVAIAVDAVRNQVFVANMAGNSGTVIDGASLATTTLDSGPAPAAVEVEPVTAKAFFANYEYLGGLTMLDEASGAKISTAIGIYPIALAVDSASNRIYVANSYSNTVSVVAGGTSQPLQFVPLTPCRLVDTRQAHGPFGGPYLSGGITRSFAVPQSTCNVPSDAATYALNVTVVPRTRSLNYLTLWPTGEQQPLVSTLNSPDGRVKANAAIVPAGAGGAVSVYVTDATDVIVDINGYFRPPHEETLQFYPLAPCRVLDTRQADGSLGGPYLSGRSERDFPVLTSNCQIPTSALAYSMNFAVVPVAHKALGYLTVWPAGTPQPIVSTLNNPTATTLANAAIVPAGVGGAIAVYADQDTQLIGDINGYFAAPGPGGLSLYPRAPCRVIDTRSTGGAFSGRRNPAVPVATSPCTVPVEAKAYVFNATVVPIGSLGYLTLWADGDSMPGVSSLNATDGMVASNMAIVGNKNGAVGAFAYGTTQLILDLASYFAP
jgi:YVTN family beta-propeller protein